MKNLLVSIVAAWLSIAVSVLALLSVLWWALLGFWVILRGSDGMCCSAPDYSNNAVAPLHTFVVLSCIVASVLVVLGAIQERSAR